MASAHSAHSDSPTPVGAGDRFYALRMTALITFCGLLISSLITSIGVLLTGERDWLSAICLALLIPLLLLPPLGYPLLLRLSSLRRENRTLQQQVREDHLTGLFNRPHLLGMLERELSLSQRHDYVVSVLLLDVADFTDLADRHGRRAADRLLRVFADRIRDKIRESDLFGRIDGAQFLLVLPHTSQHDALHMAEGLRALVTSMQVPGIEDSLQFEVRLGVASTENTGPNLNALLNEADYTLYQSRNDLRHRADQN